jgi:hypothetical protein
MAAPEAAHASQIELSKQGSEDHEAFRIRQPNGAPTFVPVTQD